MPATAPVITIKGVCATEPKPGAPCQTVITRAQFELLLSALNPRLPETARPEVADSYAKLLALATRAEKEGVANDPSFKEQMRIMRLRFLAQAYERHLRERFEKLSDAEIDQYYKSNIGRFEEATLRRVYIPRVLKTDAGAPAAPAAAASPGEAAASPQASPAAQPPPAPASPSAEDAARKLAEQVRERATKGESLDTIQQDVFAIAKTDAPAPSTMLGPRRRGSLPPSHESEVFALKPGEVSPVFTEGSALFVYKVESKRVLPLGQVREEVRRAVVQQKMQDHMSELTGSVQTTLNPDYFTATPPAQRPAAKPATPPTP